MKYLYQVMPTIQWIAFFTAIFLSFYFYLRFRNKERMALIEKGVDISEIFKNRDFSFKFPWFRIGILALWIGLGVCFTYLFIVLAPPTFTGNNHVYDEIILLISLLIFGGLGIILGHILERSGRKKNG
jgi:hypothetical protein